jgi:hypothetical protein
MLISVAQPDLLPAANGIAMGVWQQGLVIQLM